MRVLHIDTGRQMRGGQWQALYLAEGLLAAGCDCTLLAPAASPLLEAAKARAIPAFPLHLPMLAKLSRQADLLHAHDARAHTLALVTGHPRTVVARRVAFPLNKGPLARWKRRRACHFIAVSEHVREMLVAAGVPREKTTVVYDGVPLLPLSSRNGPIVAPASEDPMKGEVLLRQLEEQAGLRIKRSVNLMEDLRDGSVMVYLSQQEGLGSGVLLAMAAGVPVVASRVGGLVEVVRDEETGLLVDNSVEAVLAAVHRLLRDDALAMHLAHKGRRQVEERFTVQHLVTNTLRVYERVLSCQSRS